MVIGSYPTHFTPAFSQLKQAGSRWSHLFFLIRHLLQADTFRKDDAPADEDAVKGPCESVAMLAFDSCAPGAGGEEERRLRRFWLFEADAVERVEAVVDSRGEFGTVIARDRTSLFSHSLFLPQNHSAHLGRGRSSGLRANLSSSSKASRCAENLATLIRIRRELQVSE